MAQVTISRNTLFWRDQIISCREACSIADQAWIVVSQRGTSSDEERQILKGLRVDMLKAEKLLDKALAEFSDSVFADLRGVK